MDQITYSYTSLSSSYSSSSSSSDNHRTIPKTINSSRAPYLDSLHSVHKPIQKPVTKHFIAPLPPAPAKIYKVESSNFKEVVRMLTSTPEFQSPSTRRLKDIAPSPLILSGIPKPSIFSKPPVPPSQPQPPPPPSSKDEGTSSPLSTFTLSPGFCKFLNETLETSRFDSKSPVSDYFGSLSPLGLNSSPAPQAYDPLGAALMSPFGLLSPSSLSWCSSALLSPVSLSVFN